MRPTRLSGQPRRNYQRDGQRDGQREHEHEHRSGEQHEHHFADRLGQPFTTNLVDHDHAAPARVGERAALPGRTT